MRDVWWSNLKPSNRFWRNESNRLLLAGATLSFVVVQFDVTIVNVALQQISTSFGKRCFRSRAQ